MASRRSPAASHSRTLNQSAYATFCFHHHANIVQMVKNCYKIKINSRESKSCFYGILLSKLHQCLTIVT